MAFGKKSLRGRRYWALRQAHFTPVEARAFSQLTRKYPALQRLMAIRSAQWANFVQEARRKGWESDHRRQGEWGKRIVNFYNRERIKRRLDKKTGLSVDTLMKWVVRKDVHGRPLARPRISPWEWYDDVFQKLPDELKWDTPRSHRVKQPDVELNKIRQQRFIAGLRETAKREPERRDELARQAKRLGGRL